MDHWATVSFGDETNGGCLSIWRGGVIIIRSPTLDEPCTFPTVGVHYWSLEREYFLSVSEEIERCLLL